MSTIMRAGSVALFGLAAWLAMDVGYSFAQAPG